MLNRDVKQFGKKFMFDGNEETCWNSDQVLVKTLWAKMMYHGLNRSFHLLVCCTCIDMSAIENNVVKGLEGLPFTISIGQT